MDLKTLRGIAELMDEHGLTHLKMDVDGGKLEIDRGPREVLAPQQHPVVVLPGGGASATPAAAACAVAPAADAAPAAAPAAPAAPAVEVVEPVAPAPDDGTLEVEAPMVGVFYAAPAPGAEPFVHVGSQVKKGDTLCIVEAMKCMNEITAERDGEVVDICAQDGELVEYGRCLMKLR